MMIWQKYCQMDALFTHIYCIPFLWSVGHSWCLNFLNGIKFLSGEIKRSVFRIQDTTLFVCVTEGGSFGWVDTWRILWSCKNSTVCRIAKGSIFFKHSCWIFLHYSYSRKSIPLSGQPRYSSKKKMMWEKRSHSYPFLLLRPSAGS